MAKPKTNAPKVNKGMKLKSRGKKLNQGDQVGMPKDMDAKEVSDNLKETCK